MLSYGNTHINFILWPHGAYQVVSRISATSFTVEGDKRSLFDEGHAIQFNVGTLSTYAHVVSSSFASNLTTVVINDGVVPTGVVGVKASAVQGFNWSLGSRYTYIDVNNLKVRVEADITTLNVSANTYLTGNTYISAGSLTVQVGPTSLRSTSVTGTLAVTSNTTVGGNLTVTGNVVGATLQSTTSDVRFKEDIKALPHCLSVLSGLRPVSWTWKLDSPVCPGEWDFGFIAQWHAKNVKEATYTDDNGVMSVRYGKLEPYLVGGICELEARQRAHEKEYAAKMAELDQKIEELDSIIRSISSMVLNH